MKKPNLFIIGAPKCGTTSLARWLAEHPQVYMSPKKEPFFFDFDQPARFPVSLEQYEALFAGAGKQHRRVGEASTRYLQSRVAVGEILRYSPHARFVVMVRNPVDMAYALHEQAVASGGEPVSDFAEAWALQSARAEGKHLPIDCRDPKRFQYGAACRIGDQLERLFATVARERVHIIVLDDLRQDARGEYLRLLDFLEVEDDGRTAFPVHNAAKRVRSHLLQRSFRLAADLKVALGIRWRPGLTRFNRQTQARPMMDVALREELQDYFSGQIDTLEHLLGREFGAWRA